VAIWMELRCERRGEGRSSRSNPCFSDENSGPMLMADDTKKGVSVVAGDLFWKPPRRGFLSLRATMHTSETGTKN